MSDSFIVEKLKKPKQPRTASPLGIVGTWGREEYFIPILVQNPQAIRLLRHVQCLEERFGFHFHRLQIGTDLRNPIQRSVRVVLFAKTEKLNGELHDPNLQAVCSKA